jgi:hypothetical protein
LVVESVINALVGFVGFTAGFLYLAKDLSATKGFKSLGNCAI